MSEANAKTCSDYFSEFISVARDSPSDEFRHDKLIFALADLYGYDLYKAAKLSIEGSKLSEVKVTQSWRAKHWQQDPLVRAYRALARFKAYEKYAYKNYALSYDVILLSLTSFLNEYKKRSLEDKRAILSLENFGKVSFKQVSK